MVVIIIIVLSGLLSLFILRKYCTIQSNVRMKTVSIDDITFHYNDEKSSQKTIEMVRNFIPQVNKNISSLFSTDSKENLNIILYDNKQELLKNAKGLGEVDSFYDTSNRSIYLINFDKSFAEWEYEKLFMHEYAHYKFDLFIKENKVNYSSIPVWFIEGFAEYIGYNGSIVEYSPLSLENEKDFKLLNTTEEFEKARNEKYNPYLQSYYAIDELIKRNNQSSIKNIILKTKEMDFYKAFQLVTNMSIVEFKKVYLQEEKDNYRKNMRK